MSKPLREASVLFGIMIVAAIVFWRTLSIPPGLYDPLGAGTMPRIVCGIIVVLCALALAQLALAKPKRAKAKASTAEEKSEIPLRPWLAVGVFALMVLLAVSMSLGVAYQVSTALFLFLSIMVVVRFRPSAIIPALVLSVLVGIGVAYLFGSVFSVDLP